MKQPLLKRGGLRAISYLRRLTSAERNAAADAHLGQTLCFVAGAVNAGGFLAVGQYTSHMSGIASAVADSFALGNFVLAFLGAGALLSFMAGAACSAILINWGRRHDTRNQFTFPLLLEAVFLLCFGLFASFEDKVYLLVPLLCFIMGLQNAIITKVSQARIRTTHVTGLVTDIGIELGKLAYWNRSEIAGARVEADLGKLLLLCSLLAAFILGGIVGALGFKHLGFVTTVPLAVILLILAGLPLIISFWGNRR